MKKNRVIQFFLVIAIIILFFTTYYSGDKDKIVDGGRAVIYEGHNIRKDLLKDGQKAEEV